MKTKQQKSVHKLTATEQSLLRLNLFIIGFFVLVTWFASGMSLAIYTVVHVVLLLVTLGILVMNRNHKIIVYFVIALGLAGSLSAIWLIVSYASLFN